MRPRRPRRLQKCLLYAGADEVRRRPMPCIAKCTTSPARARLRAGAVPTAARKGPSRPALKMPDWRCKNHAALGPRLHRRRAAPRHRSRARDTERAMKSGADPARRLPRLGARRRSAPLSEDRRPDRRMARRAPGGRIAAWPGAHQKARHGKMRGFVKFPNKSAEALLSYEIVYPAVRACGDVRRRSADEAAFEIRARLGGRLASETEKSRLFPTHCRLPLRGLHPSWIACEPFGAKPGATAERARRRIRSVRGAS